MCQGVDLAPRMLYYSGVDKREFMTSQEQLDQILLELKKAGVPEIKHITLKSQVGKKHRVTIQKRT